MNSRGAFTLLELLVVLAIIGLLTALSLPAMKGISKSNTISSANRQFLDDIAQARQRAIVGRTTVHMVFVPPSVMTMTFNAAPSDQGRDSKLGEELKVGQYTSYALFAERSVGDQPGQPHSRYLTTWKTLPDGVFIAPQEFDDTLSATAWLNRAPERRPFEFIKLPFPSNNGLPQSVPHIAFDAQGRLRRVSGGIVYYDDEVIELARGSILSKRSDTTGLLTYFDLRESPPGNSTNNYNRIRIDGLTGRAKVERPEIQ